MNPDQSELNENKQPLLAHLVELRSRLIKTMIMITLYFLFFISLLTIYIIF